jgi:hypothetical protein
MPAPVDARLRSRRRPPNNPAQLIGENPVCGQIFQDKMNVTIFRPAFHVYYG